MSFKDLVRGARSIRRYDESQRISEEQLRTLVDIARVCPCGGNKQALRYRVVGEAAECNAVFPHIAWAGALPDWPGPAEGERPTGYIAVCSEGQPGTDTGIAAQTIQLAAAEMGFGACMLGAIKRDEIKKVLSIPVQYEIRLLISLGKPAEKVVIEDASTGDDLRYYRTEDEIHHVPKLKIEDVLIS